MSRPKIVVAVDSFLPRWDGVARALSELLSVLAQHATIRFLIPDYPGKRPALPGVEYVTYPLYPYLRLSDAGCPRVSNSRIRPHIAWCDVVWTHSAGPIGGRCLELGHAHGKRCVSMIHSMEWDVYSENLPFGQSWGRRYWLNHVRAIYNESHHLMTPSDSTQRALLELGFTSPIVTTPLGVDCTLFHPPTDERRMSLRRGQGLEPEMFTIPRINDRAFRIETATRIDDRFTISRASENDRFAGLAIRFDGERWIRAFV